MKKRVRSIVFLTAVLATAAPAFAQIVQPTLRQSRPSRGLFGGGVGETEQQLIATGSLGGGYDWDEGGTLTAAPGEAPTVVPGFSGKHGSGSGNLSYSLSRGRISGSALIGGSAYYNPRRSSSLLTSLGANAQVTMEVTSRTSLSASHGISRQPFNVQRLFGTSFGPDSAPDVLFDLGGAVSLSSRTWSQSAVGFSQTLTRRIQFGAQYSYQTYNGWNGAPDTRSRTQNAGARLSFSILRGVRVGAGYSYISSRFGTAAPVTYDGLTLDGGLSLDRAISLTRRTAFNFAAGVSGARDELGRTHYFLTGNGALSHEIGRSWTAAANYHRGVDFNLGFNLPVVRDNLSVGVSGLVGRRVYLNANVASAWGQLGVGPGSRDFTVHTGSIGARTALSRLTGLSAQYIYRRYEFDDAASLPIGMRPIAERHSVRVSLDLWIPLMIRARSADASR